MNDKKGFGMIEISLIITIVSFMTISTLSLYNVITRQQKNKLEELREKHAITHIEILDSHARFNKIYDAIKYFIIKNHRLPCPDHITTGTGFEECPDSDNVANNIKYGNLPYKTLNLTAEFTKDEWNNNILYYVDKRFTLKTIKHNDEDGFTMQKTMYHINNDTDAADGRVNDDDFEIIKIIDSNNNQIAPNDGLNPNIRPNASFLFVLLSGGEDGIPHNENNHNNNIFTTESDDILFFKNKQEILKDADLKYFSCSSQDSRITFNNDADHDGNLGSCNNDQEISFQNAMFGDNIYSQAICPCDESKIILRKCQSYGIWQDIEEMLTNQCNQNL